jgi:hypothetical protein
MTEWQSIRPECAHTCGHGDRWIDVPDPGAGGGDRDRGAGAAWGGQGALPARGARRAPGDTVGQGQLAEALWGEHTPRSATNGLQNYCCGCRGSCGPPTGGDRHPIGWAVSLASPALRVRLGDVGAMAGGWPSAEGAAGPAMVIPSAARGRTRPDGQPLWERAAGRPSLRSGGD